MAGLHLIKLSVGTEDVAGLRAWQDHQRLRWADGLPRHVTRMWPKRADDLCDGGSIYWVIKGVIQARQRILRCDEVTGEDGVRRCALVLDSDLIETHHAPRRPFQGWRYLQAEDAPPDVTAAAQGEEPLPEALRNALSEIGLI